MNWARWRERLAVLAREVDGAEAADLGSRVDIEPGGRLGNLRPGRIAAWIFRHEDEGERIKR